VAEAAHSWAYAGNEVFLLVANRRSRRPPDDDSESDLAGPAVALEARICASPALAGAVLSFSAPEPTLAV